MTIETPNRDDDANDLEFWGKIMDSERAFIKSIMRTQTWMLEQLSERHNPGGEEE